jgi:hypothetical protein
MNPLFRRAHRSAHRSGRAERTAARTPKGFVAAEPEEELVARFDGRIIHAASGQTIAAALWAEQLVAWRTTRVDGKPRGVFCGIGVCFDCLVSVNGKPNQRACLTPVRAGDDIRTQRGHGHEAGDGGRGHGDEAEDLRPEHGPEAQDPGHERVTEEGERRSDAREDEPERDGRQGEPGRHAREGEARSD